MGFYGVTESDILIRNESFLSSEVSDVKPKPFSGQIGSVYYYPLHAYMHAYMHITLSYAHYPVLCTYHIDDNAFVYHRLT